MSNYKSLTNEAIYLLDAEASKDCDGTRAETYSQVIIRLIKKAGNPEAKRLIKKAN